MTPYEIDRRLTALAGEMLNGNWNHELNREFHNLQSARTEGLVNLSSVRDITRKWKEERRNDVLERIGSRRSSRELRVLPRRKSLVRNLFRFLFPSSL